MRRALILIFLLFNVGQISCPNVNNKQIRIRKNADIFLRLSLERLHMIARVATGIDLQKRLLNGSVPHDELLGELLNLGSVRPSQIMKLDGEKVKETLESVRDLKERLNGDAEVKSVEEYFGIVKGMKDYLAGVGSVDVSKWNENGQFESVFGKLRTNGVTLNEFRKLENRIKYFASSLTTIETTQYDFTDSFDTGQAFTATGNLQNVSSIIYPLLDSVSTELKNLVVPNYNTTTEALKEVVAARNAVDFYFTTGLVLQSNEGRSGINQNIQLFSKTASDFEAIIPALKTIGDVIAKRNLAGVFKKPRLLFGFTDGERDISAIHANLRDEWMSVVTLTPKLGDALKPLIALQYAASQANEKMGQIDESVESLLETMISESERFTALANQSTEAVQVLDGLHGCQKSLTAIFPTNSIAEMITKGQALDENLKRRRELITKVLNDIQASKTVISEISAIADKAKNDGNTMKAVIKELKGSPSFSKVKNLMNQLKQRLLNAPEDIKTAAGGVMNEFLSVKLYIDELKSFGPYFKCLAGLDAALAISKIQNIKAFRDGPKSPINYDEGIQVVQKITGSTQKLRDTQRVIEGFKKTPSSKEMKGLDLLKDPSKSSEAIGLATRSLLKLSALLAIRKEFDALGANYPAVLAEMSVATQEDKDNLERIPNVPVQLNELFAMIKKWKVTAKEPIFSKPEEYHYLIKNAASIPDVSENLDPIIKSLDTLMRLTQTNQTQLKEVKNTLEKVKELDLNFASFRKVVDSSKEKLIGISTFFSAFASFTATIEESGKEEEESSKGLFIGLGAAAAFILLLIAAAFLAWWFYFKDRLKPEPIPMAQFAPDELARLMAKAVVEAVKRIPRFKTEQVPYLTWEKKEEHYSGTPLNLECAFQFVGEIYHEMKKLNDIDAKFYNRKPYAADGFHPFCYQFCTDDLLTKTPPSSYEEPTYADPKDLTFKYERWTNPKAVGSEKAKKYRRVATMEEKLREERKMRQALKDSKGSKDSRSTTPTQSPARKVGGGDDTTTDTSLPSAVSPGASKASASSPSAVSPSKHAVSPSAASTKKETEKKEAKKPMMRDPNSIDPWDRFPKESFSKISEPEPILINPPEFEYPPMDYIPAFMSEEHEKEFKKNESRERNQEETMFSEDDDTDEDEEKVYGQGYPASLDGPEWGSRHPVVENQVHLGVVKPPPGKLFVYDSPYLVLENGCSFLMYSTSIVQDGWYNADLYHQLEQSGARHVVQFMRSWKSCKPYWPNAVGEVMERKNVTITCKHVVVTDVTVRVLQVRIDRNGEISEFVMTHILVYGWDDYKRPMSMNAILEGLKCIQKAETPVFVISTLPWARNGVFLTLEIFKQHLCRPKWDSNFAYCFDKVRNHEESAMYWIQEVATALILAVEMCADAIPVKQRGEKKYENFMRKVGWIRKGYNRAMKEQQTHVFMKKKCRAEYLRIIRDERTKKLEKDRADFAKAHKLAIEQKDKLQTAEGHLFFSTADMGAQVKINAYEHHNARLDWKEREEKDKKIAEKKKKYLEEMKKKEEDKKKEEGKQKKEDKKEKKEEKKEKKEEKKKKEEEPKSNTLKVYKNPVIKTEEQGERMQESMPAEAAKDKVEATPTDSYTRDDSNTA